MTSGPESISQNLPSGVRYAKTICPCPFGRCWWSGSARRCSGGFGCTSKSCLQPVAIGGQCDGISRVRRSGQPSLGGERILRKVLKGIYPPSRLRGFYRWSQANLRQLGAGQKEKRRSSRRERQDSVNFGRGRLIIHYVILTRAGDTGGGTC